MSLAEAENGLNYPFANTTSPPNGSTGVSGRKRPSEDGDDGSVPSKRGPIPLENIPAAAPVASRSNLQEKNKMLASLLAKEPATLAAPPQVHPSFIHAVPQDRLKAITNVTTSTRGSAPGESYVPLVGYYK